MHLQFAKISIHTNQNNSEQETKHVKNVNIKDFWHHYRDAESNGTIGVRGYFNYFMDVTTEYMYYLGKGNDTLPDTHKSAWLYTKYKLKIHKNVEFKKPLHIETWLSMEKQLRINQDMEIFYDGNICCEGRMEACVFNIETQSISNLDSIGMPMDLQVDRKANISAFSRPNKKIDDMTAVYDYHVRYTNIDKSRHMSNVQYIPIFMDAHTPDFYAENFITEAEIHFINQAFYGDELKILKRENTDSVELTAVRNSTIVAWFKLDFIPKEQPR